MNWKQSKIEEILKNYLLINSNSDTFYNCHYKCANKNQVFHVRELNILAQLGTMFF